MLAASRYSGAITALRNSTSSTSVTISMIGANDAMLSVVAVIASPAAAVSPPTSTRAPVRPAARTRPGSRRWSACSSSMAVAPSGSVARITPYRAADPVLASIGFGTPSWAAAPAAPANPLSSEDTVAGPMTPATPGSFARECCKLASARVWLATPFPVRRISVGDRMPAANPCDAAAWAWASCVLAGSAVISGAPSRRFVAFQPTASIRLRTRPR